jgi:hypothetical protein
MNNLEEKWYNHFMDNISYYFKQLLLLPQQMTRLIRFKGVKEESK